MPAAPPAPSEEPIGLKEEAQDECSVGRRGDMLAPSRTPHEVARCDLAIVIYETTVKDVGLLKPDMLVQRQFGTRLPAEQTSHQACHVVLQERFHFDASERCWLPLKVANIYETRSEWPKRTELIVRGSDAHPVLPCFDCLCDLRGDLRGSQSPVHPGET